MTDTETAGNCEDTASYYTVVANRLDHIDAVLHELDRKVSEMHQVVTDHKPLLEAFTGSGVRKFLGVGRKT